MAVLQRLLLLLSLLALIACSATEPDDGDGDSSDDKDSSSSKERDSSSSEEESSSSELIVYDDWKDVEVNLPDDVDCESVFKNTDHAGNLGPEDLMNYYKNVWADKVDDEYLRASVRFDVKYPESQNDDIAETGDVMIYNGKFYSNKSDITDEYKSFSDFADVAADADKIDAVVGDIDFDQDCFIVEDFRYKVAADAVPAKVSLLDGTYHIKTSNVEFTNPLGGHDAMQPQWSQFEDLLGDLAYTYTVIYTDEDGDETEEDLEVKEGDIKDGNEDEDKGITTITKIYELLEDKAKGSADYELDVKFSSEYPYPTLIKGTNKDGSWSVEIKDFEVQE